MENFEFYYGLFGFLYRRYLEFIVDFFLSIRFYEFNILENVFNDVK